VGLGALRHDFLIAQKVELYGEKILKLAEGAKAFDKRIDARFEYCDKLERENAKKDSGERKQGGNRQANHRSNNRGGGGGGGGAKRRSRSREREDK
jgi:hypothetical protein